MNPHSDYYYEEIAQDPRWRDRIRLDEYEISDSDMSEDEPPYHLAQAEREFNANNPPPEVYIDPVI